MRVFALSTAALVAVTTCAAAVEPVAAAPVRTQSQALRQERIVHIPFAPPLGEPARFRIEKTEERSGRVRTTIENVVVAFVETDGGYRVTAQHEPVGEPPAREVEYPAEFAHLARQPYSLRLDTAGEIIGLEQEQVYLDALTAMGEAMAQRMDSPASATGVRTVIRQIQEMPSEDRLRLLASNVEPLLGFGDVELTVGERFSVPIEIPTVFGRIAAETHLTLVEARNGVAEIRSHTQVTSAEFREFMIRVLEQFTDTERRDEMVRAMEDADFSLTMRETYWVSTDTGLLERYEHERNVTAGQHGNRSSSRHIWRINRQD